MMENRSFDHVLGWLPGANGRQKGLTYPDKHGVGQATWPLAPDFQGCVSADAAVAGPEVGNVGSALKRLVRAVEALSDINPATSLRAAYCHRVVRHTVLWTQSRIEGSEVKIGGKPIEMRAGPVAIQIHRPRFVKLLSGLLI
jgi:hypothetical protein